MVTGISKFALLLSLLLVYSSSHTTPKEMRVLVLYPMTSSPLKSIYASTIKGIKNKVNSLTFIKVPETATVADLQLQIDHHRPDKIIVLGNKTAHIIKKSHYAKQVIAGLLYFNPSELNGVSLTLDSQSLLIHLARLTPAIKRVFIVQNSNQHVIEPHPSNLTTQPLLVIREGNDLLTNMRLLGQILEQEATVNDAIVLPAHIPNDILYEVSKIAWNKNIMLLSTNLSHLKYGVMMTFYPNMVSLGEQLGDLANNDMKTYETAKTVDVSLNKRVAQHLGIEFKQPLLDSFSIILK